MQKLVLAAVAALGLAAPAMAASSPTALISLPGSEVRRSTTQGDERREEVLHLHTNGRLTGNYQITRTGLIRGGVEFRHGSIDGRWRIVGGRLCMAGAGLSEGPQTCYRVVEARGGKRQFAATNVSTGEIWQMFIFPDEVR